MQTGKQNKTKQNPVLQHRVSRVLSRWTVTGHSWLSLTEQEEPQGRAALPPLPNATFIKSAQAVMANKTFTLCKVNSREILFWAIQQRCTLSVKKQAILICLAEKQANSAQVV